VSVLSTTNAPPAFELPAALLEQGYGLRPEADADIPFLMALFATTREEELSPLPWTAEQKAAFCAQQFYAQRHHYYAELMPCRFDVITHRDAPIGRLYLQENKSQFYVVDVSLMPDIRGRGLGTAIFSALHEAARASGRSVGFMVEKFNRALGLYRRLGYREVEDYGVYFGMVWTPEGVS